MPVVAISASSTVGRAAHRQEADARDLRESGSIEQDADMVMLLHREDAYERESPRAGRGRLHRGQAPQRPDRQQSTVAFQGHYSRFVDMAH